MKLCISPLFSSSSGNSTYVGTEKVGILVDAGRPGKYIEQALQGIGKSPKELSAILVTHEHSDHIQGIGVLSRKYDLSVYANARTWEAMEGKIGGIASKNMRVIDDGEFFVGDICARPIPLSHDAADPVGYSLSAGGKKLGIVTDTGRITRSMLDALMGANIVLLESNHDVDMLKTGRYPQRLKSRILSGKGHLSNADAGLAAIQLVERGVRGILLGHLSKENNLETLAYQTVSDVLASESILPGRDVALATTKKNSVTGFFPL